MNKVGAIILAAGASTRLGQPKQLLTFQNETLIQRIITQVQLAGIKAIVVVTGADADKINRHIPPTINTVFNNEWLTGMASGIKAGLEQLQKKSTFSSILITVCDQPFVDAALLKEIIHVKSIAKKGIVASSYAETIGTPVLFDAQYIDALTNLKGSEGAKKLLKLYAADVATVTFAKGVVDIDTIDDYKNLLGQQQSSS